MASFYVASSLSNHVQVSNLIRLLRAAGHVCTFDWTPNATLQWDETDKHALRTKLGVIAADEINRVICAENVIVLLPGGYGTHVELGSALLTNADIFLCYTDEAHLKAGGKYCAFHWHPSVQRRKYDNLGVLAAVLVDHMNATDEDRAEGES